MDQLNVGSRDSRQPYQLCESADCGSADCESLGESFGCGLLNKQLRNILFIFLHYHNAKKVDDVGIEPTATRV